VLGPVAGVFTDRWDRRRLMIATSLFRAGAVAAMLLGVAPGRYWVLYAALVAENAGGVLYAPAAQARTPAIVGTGSVLSSANSLNAFAGGTMQLIGGPLGGILLTLCGVRWLICADAVSYLICAAANVMTSPAGGQHTGRTATVSGVARDLREGMRVLRGQPAARALLPVTVIFLAANASLSAVLIPFGVQRLGGSEHTGFLLSCLGAGVLLSAPALRVLLSGLLREPARRAGQRRILSSSRSGPGRAGQRGHRHRPGRAQHGGTGGPGSRRRYRSPGLSRSRERALARQARRTLRPGSGHDGTLNRITTRWW